MAAEFSAIIQTEKEDNENDNTFLSYNPKKLEFIAFCEHIYAPPMALESKHRLTPDKFYNYLYYQSRRAQYKTGKKKDRNKSKFDGKFYDKLLLDPALCAEKPLGYEGVNQYKCSLVEVHQYEIDHEINACTKEQLLSKRVADLMSNVRLRYDITN